MKRRRAAEFFAGIGLVRLALERAGWKVSFANDIDPLKYKMYHTYFDGNHFFLGSISDVSVDMIPEVELATASFPCIDVSLAGNRAGLNGRHSSTYWEFYRLLKQLRSRRPRYVLLENVTGLLSSNAGRDLRSIVESLGKLGYFSDILVVDAVHFVPQSRPRFFLAGSLEHLKGSSTFPYRHDARPPLVMDFIIKNSKLRWSHLALPPLPPKRNNLADYLEWLPPSSPEWWDKERQEHLFGQMSPLHNERLKSLVEAKEVGFATVYKRVRPSGCRAELRVDGVAGCLRTPRGGSSKQFVIEAGFGEWKVRNMTAREYARLQGVPDSFDILVPYNQALLGFGDAVCVPVVEWVIRNCFGRKLGCIL